MVATSDYQPKQKINSAS